MVKHLEQTLAKWEEKIITFMVKRFLSKNKMNALATGCKLKINFCKIEKSEWNSGCRYKYLIPYGMLFNDFK